MSRGRSTPYSSFTVQRVPPPKREQFLEHDVFYPCQLCGWLWPKKDLRRSPDRKRILVCPSDYDMPTVGDVQNRQSVESYHRWFDFLRLNLEELP